MRPCAIVIIKFKVSAIWSPLSFIEEKKIHYQYLFYCLGRILNRFSKDMGAVDELLPRVMIESIQVYLVMAGILLQVLIINWWMIFAIAIMGFAYWNIQQIYIPAARGIKRLEGTSKYHI